MPAVRRPNVAPASRTRLAVELLEDRTAPSVFLGDWIPMRNHESPPPGSLGVIISMTDDGMSTWRLPDGSPAFHPNVFKIANEPPAVVQNLSVSVDEDSGPISIDLFALFDDPDDPDSALRYHHRYDIHSSSTDSIFKSVRIDQTNGVLTIEVMANAYGSLTFEVRATDPVGKSAIATIPFVVHPVNDAPMLVPQHLRQVASYVEQNPAFPVGALTSMISDVDVDALKGIAITRIDDRAGPGQYSLDGGTTWTDIGPVSESHALLLPSEEGVLLRLRDPQFPVNLRDWIEFRAWDRTSGDVGGYADASVHGGTTAFSNSVDTFSIRLQPTVGWSFQVNSYLPYDQDEPAVARNAAGDAVVVWTSFNRFGTPNSRVVGQRYDAGGNPVGTEFEIPRSSSGSQRAPAVALDSAGRFVVAWCEFDGDGWGVFVQRYAADGARVGGPIRVHPGIAGEQIDPSVALADDGSILVVWSSYDYSQDDFDVFGRRLDFDGQATSDVFRVNTSSGWQVLPYVAMNAFGDAVVTWTGWGPDDSTWHVYAQRFDAEGTIGGEIRAGATAQTVQFYSTAALDVMGDFVLAWSGDDPQLSQVYAQWFTAGGLAVADPVLVSDPGSGAAVAASVAMDGMGRTAVAWSGSDDGDGWGIFGRFFDAQGQGVGDAFPVNDGTASDQAYARLAASVDGDMTVVWAGTGYTDPFGVFGQRLRFSRRDQDRIFERVARAVIVGLDPAPSLPPASPVHRVSDATRPDFDIATQLAVALVNVERPVHGDRADGELRNGPRANELPATQANSLAPTNVDAALARSRRYPTNSHATTDVPQAQHDPDAIVPPFGADDLETIWGGLVEWLETVLAARSQ